MKISQTEALSILKNEHLLFKELFRKNRVSVEFYVPKDKDLQNPHAQDEFYFIASGSSKFMLENQILDCQKGDFLFVEAGKEHRFIDFSSDFSTWVIFF